MNTPNIQVAVGLISQCVCVVSALATVYTVPLNPVADNFIRGGTYANTKHEGSTSIYVKNGANPDFDRMCYLRFDLSALNRSSVDTAKLRLWAHNGVDASNVTVRIYGIADDTWDSANMTWNSFSPNHDPAVGNTIITGVGTTASLLGTISMNGTYQYYELDVTAFINAEFLNNAASFIVVDETGADKTIVINSVENTANKPELTVTYDDAPIVVPAAADAHVGNGNSAALNFGTAASLLVKNSTTDGRMSYLKFTDLSLPDQSVKRATLRMYAQSTTGTAPRHLLYGNDSDNWTESAVAWNNSPNHVFDPDTYGVADVASEGRFVRNFSVPTSGTWVEVDITDAMNERFNGGSKIVTFVLAAAGANSNNVSFSSRESAVNSPPQIVATGFGTYTATADTYIRNGSFMNDTFGTAINLDVSRSTDWGRVAYLRFDLSSIPVQSGVDPFTSVKLRLYPATVQSGGNSINLFLVNAVWSGTWAETGTGALTWANNVFLHDSQQNGYRIINTNTLNGLLLSQRLVGSSPGYIDYNVTDYVNRQLWLGDATFSFMAVSDDTSGSSTSYASNQDATPANRPKLLLERNTLPSNLTKLSDTIIANDGLTFPYGAYGLMPNLLVYTQEALITANGYQYAAYYNAARHVCVARRPVGAATWEVAELSDYYFATNDTHNNLSMGHCAVDGTLHLAFDHHKNDLNYRKSVPGVTTNPTAVTWGPALFGPVQDKLAVGESTVQDFTYPRFMTKPDGNLLLRYRYWTSGNGDGTLYEYIGSTGAWTKLGAYDVRSGSFTFPGTSTTSTGRNSYPDALIYRGNRLHTSWTWRETSGPGTRNHDVHYAYSDDHGRTWRNSGGTLVGTVKTDPINITKPTLVATVESTRSMGNDGGLYVDPNGIVHIVALHNDSASSTGDYTTRTYHHYFRDETGQWNSRELGFRGSRPKVLATDTDVYLVFGYTQAGARLQGGGLAIARATKASNYTDWQIIRVEQSASGRGYKDTPLVDLNRFETSRVISVFTQEPPAYAGEATPIHVIEFQIP